MAEPDNSAVPKFGSFKPREPKDKIDDDPKPRKESSRHHGRYEERKHSRRNDDSERKHRSERKDRSRSPARRVKYPEVKERVRSPESDESDLFILDRRGDRKNVEYGRLHRYSVPQYYRTGYGNILGLSGKMKIIREESTEDGISVRLADRPQKRQQRQLTSKAHGLFTERLKRVIPVEVNDDTATPDDYIPLRPSLKRKRGSDLPSPDAAFIDTVDYRSIEGKAKPSDKPVDDDLDFASESDDDHGLGDLELQVRQQTALLTRATKENPRDFTAWKALIDHQDHSIRPSATAVSLSSNEKRALADIKLSIYDKALKNFQRGHPAYDDILLGIMQNGKFIWETSRLAKRWDEMLKENPASIRLWTYYLDYLQTDYSSFTFESCKAAYLRCLKILHDSGTKNNVEEKAGVATTQIYVLLRYTAFIRDAGYDELAIAIWQMILEYALCSPRTINDVTTRQESFGEFWDSEVSRLGEQDAEGWSQFVAQGKGPDRQSASGIIEPLDLQRPLQSFATQEYDLFGRLHLPAAADDDSAVDDPFRYVMFSDLEPVLRILINDLPRSILLNGFLTFMHFPLLSDSEDDCHNWGTDQYLRNQPYGKTINNIRQTTYGLFDDAFDSLDPTDNAESSLFVDRVLEQAQQTDQSKEALAEYSLALKLHFFPDTAAKAAKRALKSRPSSMRLYNAYALIEAKLGRFAKSQEVWPTAIGMNLNLDMDTTNDTILLKHNWTISALGHGTENDTLRALLFRAGASTKPHSVTTGREISSTEKLRATQEFLHGWSASLDRQQYDLAVLYAECSAWLSYLTSDHELETVLPLFKTWTTSLTSRKATSSTETLHQAKARLITHHITKNRLYKPALIRSTLAESIRAFPSNTLLLSAFTQNEARFHLHDRIRTSLQYHDLGVEQPSIAMWSLLLEDEIRRYMNGSPGSTENSVRNTFARALLESGSGVSHSPALWTQWFWFEHPTRYERMLPPRKPDERERMRALQQAKRVFLDGLRFLPWCKVWVILGLRTFSTEGGMEGREVERVYGILGERELRVRVDVEGVERAMGR